jgi:hypothetical protein
MTSLPFDFSKPPHPKTIDLFLPFIPGLFFEISIFWGKPEIISIFTRHPVSNAGYYIRVAMAMFCAYFVGFAVMMTIGILQYIMKNSLNYVHRLSASIKKMIYRFTGRRLTNPNSISRRIINPIQGWWIRRDIQRESNVECAYQVWAQAAVRLLESRYGISPPAPTEIRANSQMSVWHNVLGTATAEEIRGSYFIRAMHGSGWLGLVATQIAPVLWNRYYLGLSGAMVLQGLINDFLVSKSWCNRVYDIEIRTRCVLREIPQVKTGSQLTEVPNEEPLD